MTTTPQTPVAASFDRRGFLRIGGLSAASFAVLAACGGEAPGAGPEVIPQSGTAPPLAEAPTVTVSDGMLLRTATSLHYNGIDLISALDKLGALGVAKSAASAYAEVLKAQADVLSAALSEIGGTPFEASNPVVDRKIVQPALALVEASDSKEDDGARLVHAFVSLAAAVHLALVPHLSLPELRQTSMQIGTVHATASALLAAAISPDNVVSETAVAAAAPSATTTTVADVGLPTTAAAAASDEEPALPVLAPVEIYQVPGAFGALSPVQIVLGNSTATDAAKRVQLGLDTPSLNSYILDDQTA